MGLRDHQTKMMTAKIMKWIATVMKLPQAKSGTPAALKSA